MNTSGIAKRFSATIAAAVLAACSVSPAASPTAPKFTFPPSCTRLQAKENPLEIVQAKKESLKKYYDKLTFARAGVEVMTKKRDFEAGVLTSADEDARAARQTGQMGMADTASKVEALEAAKYANLQSEIDQFKNEEADPDLNEKATLYSYFSEDLDVAIIAPWPGNFVPFDPHTAESGLVCSYVLGEVEDTAYPSLSEKARRSDEREEQQRLLNVQ